MRIYHGNEVAVCDPVKTCMGGGVLEGRAIKLCSSRMETYLRAGSFKGAVR